MDQSESLTSRPAKPAWLVVDSIEADAPMEELPRSGMEARGNDRTPQQAATQLRYVLSRNRGLVPVHLRAKGTRH
jgi:hypothetical protein